MKEPTSAFTCKSLLRHFGKQAPKHVKFGPRHNHHKGPVALRIYANQPARPTSLITLRQHTNFNFY